MAQKSFNTSIMISKIQEWISFKEKIWVIPHYEWKPTKDIILNWVLLKIDNVIISFEFKL